MKHKFFSIITKNAKELSEFYESILQSKPKILDIDNYIEMEIDDFTICMESIQSVENRSGASITVGTVLIEFEVKEVDEEYARLKQLGIDIAKSPFDNPWGTRNFYFKDPEGNLICFYMTMQK